MPSGQVPSTYIVPAGRIPEYFEKIRRGTPPSKFTQEYLVKLGFKSTNDRPLIPLLRALGFLNESNQPTQTYYDYLDEEKSRVILGKQILAAYDGVFEVDREAHKLKASQLDGKFKSVAHVSDSVSKAMASTFVNLCSIADVDRARTTQKKEEPPSDKDEKEVDQTPKYDFPLGLNYRIEINLPNTTDWQVYNAIFKALRENLLR